MGVTDRCPGGGLLSQWSSENLQPNWDNQIYASRGTWSLVVSIPLAELESAFASCKEGWLREMEFVITRDRYVFLCDLSNPHESNFKIEFTVFSKNVWWIPYSTKSSSLADDMQWSHIERCFSTSHPLLILWGFQLRGVLQQVERNSESLLRKEN